MCARLVENLLVATSIWSGTFFSSTSSSRALNVWLARTQSLLTNISLNGIKSWNTRAKLVNWKALNAKRALMKVGGEAFCQCFCNCRLPFKWWWKSLKSFLLNANSIFFVFVFITCKVSINFFFQSNKKKLYF